MFIIIIQHGHIPNIPGTKGSWIPHLLHMDILFQSNLVNSSPNKQKYFSGIYLFSNVKNLDVRFCPKCDSYLRYKRLPGGTGYWVCSSCSYTEGAPPASVLEPEPPVKKAPVRHVVRRTATEDTTIEEFDPAMHRLKEILLRIPSPLSKAQISSLTERGFLTQFHEQFRLTPKGQQILHLAQGGVSALSNDEVGFLNLLTHYPRTEDLHSLEQRGLITLQDGQPALTIKGTEVRDKLQKEFERKAAQSKAASESKRRVSRNRY